MNPLSKDPVQYFLDRATPLQSAWSVRPPANTPEFEQWAGVFSKDINVLIAAYNAIPQFGPSIPTPNFLLAVLHELSTYRQQNRVLDPDTMQPNGVYPPHGRLVVDPAHSFVYQEGGWWDAYAHQSVTTSPETLPDHQPREGLVASTPASNAGPESPPVPDTMVKASRRTKRRKTAKDEDYSAEAADVEAGPTTDVEDGGATGTKRRLRSHAVSDAAAPALATGSGRTPSDVPSARKTIPPAEDRDSQHLVGQSGDDGPTDVIAAAKEALLADSWDFKANQVPDRWVPSPVPCSNCAARSSQCRVNLAHGTSCGYCSRYHRNCDISPPSQQYSYSADRAWVLLEWLRKPTMPLPSLRDKKTVKVPSWFRTALKTASASYNQVRKNAEEKIVAADPAYFGDNLTGGRKRSFIPQSDQEDEEADEPAPRPQPRAKRPQPQPVSSMSHSDGVVQAEPSAAAPGRMTRATTRAARSNQADVEDTADDARAAPSGSGKGKEREQQTLDEDHFWGPPDDPVTAAEAPHPRTSSSTAKHAPLSKSASNNRNAGGGANKPVRSATRGASTAGAQASRPQRAAPIRPDIESEDEDLNPPPVTRMVAAAPSAFWAAKPLTSTSVAPVVEKLPSVAAPNRPPAPTERRSQPAKPTSPTKIAPLPAPQSLTGSSSLSTSIGPIKAKLPNPNGLPSVESLLSARQESTHSAIPSKQPPTIGSLPIEGRTVDKDAYNRTLLSSPAIANQDAPNVDYQISILPNRPVDTHLSPEFQWETGEVLGPGVPPADPAPWDRPRQPVSSPPARAAPVSHPAHLNRLAKPLRIDNSSSAPGPLKPLDVQDGASSHAARRGGTQPGAGTALGDMVPASDSASAALGPSRPLRSASPSKVDPSWTLPASSMAVFPSGRRPLSIPPSADLLPPAASPVQPQTAPTTSDSWLASTHLRAAEVKPELWGIPRGASYLTVIDAFNHDIVALALEANILWDATLLLGREGAGACWRIKDLEDTWRRWSKDLDGTVDHTTKALKELRRLFEQQERKIAHQSARLNAIEAYLRSKDPEGFPPSMGGDEFDDGADFDNTAGSPASDAGSHGGDVGGAADANEDRDNVDELDDDEGPQNQATRSHIEGSLVDDNRLASTMRSPVNETSSIASDVLQELAIDTGDENSATTDRSPMLLPHSQPHSPSLAHTNIDNQSAGDVRLSPAPRGVSPSPSSPRPFTPPLNCQPHSQMPERAHSPSQSISSHESSARPAFPSDFASPRASSPTVFGEGSSDAARGKDTLGAFEDIGVLRAPSLTVADIPMTPQQAVEVKVNSVLEHSDAGDGGVHEVQKSTADADTPSDTVQ